MKYLLDTCVISELVKKKTMQKVKDWIKSCDEDYTPYTYNRKSATADIHLFYTTIVLFCSDYRIRDEENCRNCI